MSRIEHGDTCDSTKKRCNKTRFLNLIQLNFRYEMIILHIINAKDTTINKIQISLKTRVVFRLYTEVKVIVLFKKERMNFMSNVGRPNNEKYKILFCV